MADTQKNRPAAAAAAPMHRFSRWRSLRARLILGTGAMLLPLLALAVVGYLFFQSVTAGMDHVVTRVFDQMVPLSKLSTAVQRGRLLVEPALIQRDPAALRQYKQLVIDIDRTFNRFDEGDVSLRTDLAADLEGARETWQSIRQQGASLPAGSNADRALTSLLGLYANLERRLQHINNDILAEIQFERNRARATQRHVIVLIGAVSVIGLFVAIAAAVMLARTILVPLADLNRAAARFGTGDLQFRIERIPSHELGKVAQTFNTMADTIERHQASLQHMAIRDALTGQYNRREFKARLGMELQRARRYSHPFAVLLIDIDHFKKVNDTYGHPAGDRVLVTVAGALHDSMRPADTVARYGGEEFAVILPETRAETAVAMAERLRECVAEQSVHLGNEEIRVTASVGVAAFPQHGGRTDVLMQEADRALYAAKAAGRDRVLLADPDAGATMTQA
ncbi:MAG: diguanylate cyclase [Gammaproteobacteria bacterium]